MIRNTVNQITVSKSESRRYQGLRNKGGGGFSSALMEAMEGPSLNSKNKDYYKVKRGDSLIKIVRNLTTGSSTNWTDMTRLVKQIAKDNGILDPDLILEGQNLDVSSLLKSQNPDRPSPSAPKEDGVSSGNRTEDLSQTELESGIHEDSTELLKLIGETSLSNGVNPYISIAIARAESGTTIRKDDRISLNPYAVNRDSKSKGLFQLIDKTGERFHRMLGLQGKYDPFNVRQNIRIGVNYLKYLDSIFAKDTVLTTQLRTIAVPDPYQRKYFSIAAYNAGEGRVARAQQLAKADGKDPGIFKNIEKYLPYQTRMYVNKVERFIEKLT